MKKRVSLLLMLLLALALVFALGSCGDHEHTEGEPQKENEFAGNCKQVASYDEVIRCTDCGEEISRKTVFLENLGTHVWSDATYENNDTVNCAEGGIREKVKTCTVEGCGAVTREIVELPKAEHSLKTKTVYNVPQNVCENASSVRKQTIEYCENCSYEKVVKTENEAKTSGYHSRTKDSNGNWKEDNVCKYCSYVKSSTTAGIVYVLNEDGASYTLTEVEEGTKVATLRVGYYKGLPVTHIAAKAFKGSSVQFVTIGSTVKYIGEDAFDGCSIANVNIYDIKAWCEIEFANDAANPASVSAAFTVNGKKLGGVLTLPSNVKSVSGYAFANAPIYSVHISNNLTEIESNAFYNCALLKNVHVEGESRKSFAKNAFANCQQITNVFAESLNGWLNVSFEDLTANPVTMASNFYVAGKTLGTALEIPDGITGINAYAFATLGIESVKIPASVEVIGDGAFANCQALVSVEFAENSALKFINKEAFLNCVKLAAVSLPAGVEAIGESAFANCASITELKLGASLKEIGNYAFLGCANVVTLTFGDNLDTIGEKAFSGLSKVSELKIPDSVDVIGLGAFEGFDSLVKITLPFVGNAYGSDENTNFGYIFGATEVVLKDKDGNETVIPAHDSNRTFVPVLLKEVVITRETKICASAFSGCEGVMSITIPDTVNEIGSGAFEGCTSLSAVHFPSLEKWCKISFENYSANPLSVAGNLYINNALLEALTIPAEINKVNPYAFYGANIKSLNIGKDVIVVGNDAFADCAMLETVVIALDKLVSVGARAFNGCEAIETVTVNSVDRWCAVSFADAFANPLYYADALMVNGNLVTEISISSIVVNKYAFVGFKALTKVSFANVMYVGESAFAGCTGLSEVNFGISANILVADNAFKNCSALSAISLEKVKSIGDYAFAGCSAITEVVTNAEAIGNSAFQGCAALTSVKGEALKSIGVSAFSGCSKLESATYPESATVGAYAFEGCPLN